MDGERYERGRQVLERLDRLKGSALKESLEGIAPELERLVVEFAFGDILARPGLDARSREIATVAALTALGNAAPQLEVHVDWAINAGLSRQEVVEIMMQMAVYAGVPAALNGLAAARRAFEKRDADGLPDK